MLVYKCKKKNPFLIFVKIGRERKTSLQQTDEQKTVTFKVTAKYNTKNRKASSIGIKCLFRHSSLMSPVVPDLSY